MSSPSPTVQVRGGRVLPAPDPADALGQGADLVWTALVDPDDGEVPAAVAALGLPMDLVVETKDGGPEVFDPQQPTRRRRPRLVLRGEGRAVVVLPAAYDEQLETVRLGLLTVVVAGASVLSVSRGPAPDLGPLREKPPAVAAELLELVVSRVLDDYEHVLEMLDDDVDEVEAEVFSGERRSRAKRIYNLKRETMQLDRAVRPLGEVIYRMECSQALRERVLRIGEHVDRLSSLLDSVLDADLSQVGVRQNEDQRRISAWAAIALVPTIVAGIYGMNFQHMPELSWRFGYPAALLFIAGVCSALYVTFRSNGWLGRAAARDDDA